jgi:hypothetical protein
VPPRHRQTRDACHENEVYEVFHAFPGLGARPPSRVIRRRLCFGRSCDARAATGLHARRLPSMRRRNPQRPRHHRLPAAAEGQPQRRLPGGVRAVRKSRGCICAGQGATKRPCGFEKRLAPRAGFEPATIRLTVECSTAELPRNRRNPKRGCSQRAAYNKAPGACKAGNGQVWRDPDLASNLTMPQPVAGAFSRNNRRGPMATG